MAEKTDESSSNPTLSDLLTAFESAACKLNQESDAINGIFKEVEARLIKANAGVSAFVALPGLEEKGLKDERGQVFDANKSLGFMKFEDDGWALAVQSAKYVHRSKEDTDYGALTYSHERLLQTSRPVRVRALQFLPDLIEVLTTIAQGSVDTIEKAKSKLHD